MRARLRPGSSAADVEYGSVLMQVLLAAAGEVDAVGGNGWRPQDQRGETGELSVLKNRSRRCRESMIAMNTPVGSIFDFAPYCRIHGEKLRMRYVVRTGG